MLPILAIAAVSTVALGALADMLFDLGGNDDGDAEGRVDEVADEGGFDLLSAEIPSDLETEIAAGALVLDDDSVRDNYAPTGSVEIEGTVADDVIDANVDVEVVFAGAGNDQIFGADHDQVIFGDQGNDVVIGEGGEDQLFGDEGDDTIFGGEGDDLLVGGEGADVLIGGDGNDTIFTQSASATDTSESAFDVVSAGAGNDAVYVTQGSALIELGEGEDDVLVYSNSDEDQSDPISIITDFDPAEDQIVLGVYAPDYTFPDGASQMEVSYSLTSIETSQGPATLVMPAVADEALLAELDVKSVGYAVLLGVTPADIEDGNVTVIVSNAASSQSDDGSIQQVFEAQRA